MSQTLYEEAIAEARRLTEMAEQNAKNKIIDAVTPQIKRLIEQELMGDSEMEDAELDDEDSEESEEADTSAEVIDLDTLAASAGAMNPETSDAAMPVSPAPAAPVKSAPGTSLKMDNGEIEITVGGTKIEIEQVGDEGASDDDELLLDRPVAEALERMVAQSRTGRQQLSNKLRSLSERTKTLRRALEEARRLGTTDQKRRLANIFESLAQEAVTLRKQVILTEKSTGGRTPETKLVDSIIKEMKDMSRRNGKNVFDFLFEAEEGENEVKVDREKAEGLVGDLADLMGLEVEFGEGGEEAPESEEGGEEAGEEADAGDESGDADALELEADVMDGDMHMEVYGEAAKKKVKEADKAKEKAKKEADKKKAEADKKKMNETVYELDESALRQALTQMRSARRGRLGEAAVDAAASFGGGEAGDEMFIDVDEETLLNALADELGSAPKPKVGGAELATESARLRRQVADYRKVAEQLKTQLVEMNLFNAKLLYANKLMQNRDLSAKQQRAIVEALDNAKTLREAKLLYKSLTESLNKPTNRGGLTESRTRVLGSSSQSARSAQPINEAGGNDRWALLAGIKKD